jgi:hypothetical protein
MRIMNLLTVHNLNRDLILNPFAAGEIKSKSKITIKMNGDHHV